MRRVKNILMAVVLIGISASVAVPLISSLSLGDDEGYTNYYKSHPAMELLGEENNSEYCTMRYCQFTESKYFCSFSVYADLTEEQLLQMAEFVELSITGEGFNNNAGIHNLSKLSFVFYKGDTDELIDYFMYKDGQRLEPSEKDVFLPAYLNYADYMYDEEHE